MLFEAMPDVDCAIASEGSYGPIDAGAAGAERRRDAGLHRPQARHPPSSRPCRPTAPTGGCSASRRAIPNVLPAVKAHGLPALRRVRGLQQRHEPADQGAGDHGRRRDRAMDHEAKRSEDGLAVLILRHARAHRIRRACACCAPLAGSSPGGWSSSAPSAMRRASGCIGTRRGLPCEGCAEAHPLDRFRDRRLLGLRPRRAIARARTAGARRRGCRAGRVVSFCRPERSEGPHASFKERLCEVALDPSLRSG